jgi:hypothetical protein
MANSYEQNDWGSITGKGFFYPKASRQAYLPFYTMGTGRYFPLVKVAGA